MRETPRQQGQRFLLGVAAVAGDDQAVRPTLPPRHARCATPDVC